MDARARRGSSRHPELGLARLSTILVVNAGSTSLKLSLVDIDETSKPVGSFEEVSGVDAVAHRVVHGGRVFREPVVIDGDVEEKLRPLVELAPLHNAPAIDAIDAARRALPDVPHVAVFDTAFHSTIPAEASTYALPRGFREEWGIRRYGFHGLSVRWAVERVPSERVVVCHLGGGCSVTAVRNGSSVDTTMGFTPLEGVPMVTRSGSVDPGALLHLLRHGISSEQLEHALEHESGLAGLSGSSGDLRELEASRSADTALALDIFAYRVAGAVAAMTVALEGIDALVFTAGIGERSADVRARICRRLRHLGVELDEAANTTADGDADVAGADSRVRILVVHAREDVIAARDARALARV